MAAKKTVPIDWEDLQDAFETGSQEVHHFLNTSTGAIKTLSDWDDAADEIEDSEDDLAIPYISSREGWEHMQAFTETVKEPRAHASLERAIHGKGAFRRFKDTLYDLGIAEEWYAFSRAQVYDLVVAWVEDQGIRLRTPQPARPEIPDLQAAAGLAEQARRLDALADELEGAVDHARGAARLLRAGELARGWAHSLACDGHMRKAGRLLDEVACDHAEHSRAPE